MDSFSTRYINMLPTSFLKTQLKLRKKFWSTDFFFNLVCILTVILCDVKETYINPII